MKKLLCMIAFIIAIDSINAQTSTFDKRLLSKFSEKELHDMQAQNPETLNYWNYYASNAFQVMELPAQKAAAHEIKGTMKVSNLNSINIFDLHLTPQPKDYQYYKIEGTDKLLVILSEEQIKTRFKTTSK